MHKISNIGEHILENIRKVYGHNLSIHESLLLNRGRLIIMHYIPYVASSDGHVVNIIIYSAK